ncbi:MULTISPECIES: hypothetical protein [Streptacidiphilus]|uniref:Uncharacterized protein n=1 Tax=Streptacidiphilus cavernicola TaxID=3342716 RepID=A0ABV6V1D3_9ACTN|nr:hypothetical protein [Streptacidiphilus jeojiense]
MTFTPNPAGQRARQHILGEISTRGVPALAETLIHAHFGDASASRIPVAELLLALPDLPWPAVQQLLRRSGIDERETLGQLDPVQQESFATSLSALS